MIGEIPFYHDKRWHTMKTPSAFFWRFKSGEAHVVYGEPWWPSLSHWIIPGTMDTIRNLGQIPERTE